MALSENTYLFGTQNQEVFAPIREEQGSAEMTECICRDLQDGRKAAKITLKNTGNRAVLDAGIGLVSEGHALLGTDNDRILFPGEQRTFQFLLIPKNGGGFAEAGNGKQAGEPQFEAHWL